MTDDVLDVTLDEEPAPVNPAALAALEEAFGAPVIFSYTRRQAIADGVQFQAPASLAAEAGFRWPVFITSAVYEEAIGVPAGLEAQDESGRLWDVLWMARLTCAANDGPGPTPFTVYVRNDNESEPQPHEFLLQAGPVDIDDPAPSLTIMTAADL